MLLGTLTLHIELMHADYCPAACSARLEEVLRHRALYCSKSHGF